MLYDLTMKSSPGVLSVKGLCWPARRKPHNLHYNFQVVSFVSHLLTQMLVFLHSLLSNVKHFIFKLFFSKSE